MPLKNSIETKIDCQECREGRVGSWLDLVSIVHGPQLESAALLGIFLIGSSGKRIKLALANNLMYCLPSTLFSSKKRGQKEKSCHGPTPSSPSRRNYEIAPRMLSSSRGHRPTTNPDLRSGTHQLSLLIGQEGSEKGNLFKIRPKSRWKKEELFIPGSSGVLILQNFKNSQGQQLIAFGRSCSLESTVQ